MTTLLLLCLACSSSPSPRPGSSTPFITTCCARPICDRCITKNPRLRGYNPCLACLAGVAVVDKSRGHKLNGYVVAPGPSGHSQEQENDMFVLGDGDEEDGLDAGVLCTEAPPAYADEPEASLIPDDETLVSDTASEVSHEPEGSNPSRYYIQREDTLTGISLKYGVDGRTICQLNSLPFSTLTTTPHLLHTRTSLVLPPTRCLLPPPPDPEVLEARTRKRAEKRFQFVTKEVDWRVAKAYVALAECDGEMPKSKEDPEVISNVGRTTLEARAVHQYLDDGEWEARQGGGPYIGFPPFGGKRNVASSRASHL